MRSLALAFTALFLTSNFSLAAGYKGTPVVFTDGEKQTHLQNLKTLTDAAAKCLQADLARHKDFISKYGISAFYGDQSKFARHVVRGEDGKQTFVNTTIEEKRQSLRDLNFPENYVRAFIPSSTSCTPETCPNMMQPTSCVGIALKCLGKAFHAAGQDDFWKRISDFNEANGETGDSLIEALQKLGWRVYYWAPDVTNLNELDAVEQKRFPGNPGHEWGYHAYSYLTVSTKNRYYLNTVDDFTTMVNFGMGTPAHIRDVPFFVGIAHLGYHVFPGSYGTLTEGHSARALNDPLTVQSSPFSPLSESGGPSGGPSGAHYHSGIVAVPPGY